MGNLIKINIYTEAKKIKGSTMNIKKLEDNISNYNEWLKKTHKEDRIESYEEFLEA